MKETHHIPVFPTRHGYILLRNELINLLNKDEFSILLKAWKRIVGYLIYDYTTLQIAEPIIKELMNHFEIDRTIEQETQKTLGFLGDTAKCVERSARKRDIILVKKPETNL
jgi:hypothetical protein